MQYFWIALKGFLMGVADIVPGVSGGTMALISGIYDRLLHAIQSFDPKLVQLVLKREIKAAWTHVDGSFLLALLTGILCGVLSVAQILSILLDQYPALVWGGFLGLILASTKLVWEMIDYPGLKELLLTLVAALSVAVICFMSSFSLPISLWAFFVGGMIAIIAMLLPGISGAYLLVLMGLYPEVIQAIKDMNLLILGIFATGCVCGALIFSRLISYALRRARNKTMSILLGCMIGGSVKLWPWQQATSEQLVWLTPSSYAAQFPGQPSWWWVIFCMLLGSMLVALIYWLSSQAVSKQAA